MKLVLKGVLILVVLMAILLAALVFWVDINRFKPLIQDAAAERGIALEIGDMGWSFWPVLGISLADVSVAARGSPEKTIAELQQASLSAALLPLLQGDLKVDSVYVEGAAIHLMINEQGVGNWEALTAETAPAETSTDTSARKAGPSLEIDRIRIRDSALNYEDIKNDQHLRVKQLDVDVDDVNTSGAPFSMALSGLFSLEQSTATKKLPATTTKLPATTTKLEVAAKLSHQITLDSTLNAVQMKNGNLQLRLIEDPSADIVVDYSLAVSDLQKNPAYQGQLETKPLNLGKWLSILGTELQTANDEALKHFSFKSQIKGDTKQLSLEQIQLTLNDFHLSGNLAVTDFSTAALRFDVQGNGINLDDYLPPPGKVSEPDVAATEPTPLPLETLRGLVVDGKLRLNKLAVNKIVLESVDASIHALDGIIESTFSANLYQGSAALDSKIDVRPRATNSDETSENNLAYEATLDVKSLNMRELFGVLGVELETDNSDALKQVFLSTQVKGDTRQVKFEPLKITLDNTHFTGSAMVTDIETRALIVALQGDHINVDDYLPPESHTAPTAAAAPSEDTALPLDVLRDLTLQAKLNMKRMILKKMTLENVDVQVSASNGIVEQKLGARAYQGDIRFNSQLDARPEQARLDFEGGAQGIELSPLLKDMQLENKKWDLSGAIQMKAKGSTQGASVNQLIDAMDTNASFSGAQVRMSPLNIEEQFCKLVNLVTRNNTEEVTWDDFTEMRQLNGNIVWRDQVIQLQSLNAGVSQLLLESTGKINLAADKYEFKLPIKLAEASKAANLKGCTIPSPSYWVDRGLSLLRCKGSVGEINPAKDCGFDKSALGDIAKDYAEYKLREKHGAKIEAAEQQLKDKKQDLLERANEKLGGEGEVTKPRDILNNLLRKKLGGGASSSASSSSAASQQ